MAKKKREKKSTPEAEAFFADAPSYERFEALTEKLLKVPKEEVDEKRAEREKKRRQEETS
jgi:hypothetical protein